MFRRILSILARPFNWFKQTNIFTKLVIILIIGGVLYFGYNNYYLNSSSTPTYQTSQAEKGTLVSTISASGTITQGNSLNITSQATGVVSKLYFKNGDQVYKGATIAEITPDLNSAQNQAQAWAAYVNASNNLKNAENNVRNSQAALDLTLDDIHLFQYGNGGFGNVGSPNETMQQRSNRTSSEVALNNAQNNLNTAKAQIASAWFSYQQASTNITAPFSGILSSMTISEGSTITAASSNATTTPSQTLGALILPNAKLQASVNLTEIDVTKVKPGQKVTLTMDAFPGKTFTGKVLSINTNGTVSSGVTTYPTVIEFETQVEGVYPNMAVNAKIITSIKDNVILVPSGAVQSVNGESSVRVIKNLQPESVAVQIGETSDTQTEIISGINEGDIVVTGSTGNTTSGSTSTSPFSGFNRGFGGGGTVRINR